MPRVKTEAKEKAILDAAASVFARRPFHEVLIDEIASDAGIGKGTIYRYFETKDDLYFATTLHVLDRLAAVALAGPAAGAVVGTAPRADRHREPALLLGPEVPLPVPPQRRRTRSRATQIMKRREAILRFSQEAILAGHRAARAARHRRAHRRRALPRHGPLGEPLPAARGHARGARPADHVGLPRGRRRGGSREEEPLALLLAAAAAGPGCSLLPKKSVQDAVAAAPNQPWTPPPAAAMPKDEPAPPPQIPEEYTKPGTTLSLGQLVDVALRNNPATREAWFAARAAAAEVGSKRSLYFPYVEVDGLLERQKQSAVGGQFTFLQTTYGPSIAATWLLFNFGAREAEVEESTRILYAADWTHNAAIQDVVLRVAQAYYLYLNAKAQVTAREANLAEARSNLAAAEERHRGGRGDDRRRPAGERRRPRRPSSRCRWFRARCRWSGARSPPPSASMRRCPSTWANLPDDLPLDAVKKGVDELIAKAVAQRPDLAAQKFLALAAESRILASAKDGLPTLSLDASGNRTFYHRPDVGGPVLDQLGGAHLAAHPRLPRLRHGLPGPEGARGGRGRESERRTHGEPGDPRRLVELLRRRRRRRRPSSPPATCWRARASPTTSPKGATAPASARFSTS